MPRKRIYETNAEKQRAYRRRNHEPTQGEIYHEAVAVHDAIERAAMAGDALALQFYGTTPWETLRKMRMRFSYGE